MVKKTTLIWVHVGAVDEVCDVGSVLVSATMKCVWFYLTVRADRATWVLNDKGKVMR